MSRRRGGLSAFSIRSFAVAERGNALVEFALILPVFVLMTAGLMNLGSILWQLAAVADAIRYGARTSANSSNYDGPLASCATLAARAAGSTSSYVASAKTNSRGWWSPAAAGTSVAVWGSPGSPDFIQVPYVSVSMNTGATDNCVFCFENVLRRMQVDLSASFAIESGACS